MGWLLALLVLAGAPFIAEALRRPLSDTARAQTDGQFATLRHGRTHFRWHGPSDGPIALCIHGLTTPMQVYGPLIDHLTAAGYRTLAYDLPARGLSDPAPGLQTESFFLRHLNALLTDQAVGKIDLVLGYSMGGSIATSFAAQSPDRVGALVLLASTGLLHDGGAPATFMRNTPVLGDWAMITMGGALMRRDFARGGETELLALQQGQTRRRGFLSAVLSSQRQMLAASMVGHLRALDAARLPTLAIWGIEDTVIPISNVGRMAEFHRSAHQASIPGATHALPHSHAPAVWDEIKTFLKDRT